MTAPVSSGGYTLTPLQIVYVARKAGFSNKRKVAGYPSDVLFTAIALAESGGNTKAHNPTPPDNSYGLWQINMYGNLGPARRRQFGLSSNETLFTPFVNAKAAFQISNGGTNPRPWSMYTNGRYLNFISTATQAAADLNAGKDPGTIPDPALGNVIVDGDTETDFVNPFDAAFEAVTGWISDNMLRVVMFLSGGVLFVLAIYLYMSHSGAGRKALNALPAGRLVKRIAR